MNFFKLIIRQLFNNLFESATSQILVENLKFYDKFFFENTHFAGRFIIKSTCFFEIFWKHRIFKVNFLLKNLAFLTKKI